jgi:hypothetical protein
MDTTDRHELEEPRLAQRVATALDQRVRERSPKAVVVAAPPRVRAQLRHSSGRRDRELRRAEQPRAARRLTR